MTRRIALLVGTCAAVLQLCAGCRGIAAGRDAQVPDNSVVTPTPTPAASDSDGSGDAGSGSPNDLGSQLDGIQASLNNIASQLSAESTP